MASVGTLVAAYATPLGRVRCLDAPAKSEINSCYVLTAYEEEFMMDGKTYAALGFRAGFFEKFQSGMRPKIIYDLKYDNR